MMSRSTPIVSLSDAYLDGVQPVGAAVGTATSPSTPVADLAVAESADTPPLASAEDTAADTRVYCRASDLWLESAAALREHCHTDWYRYNLKRSLRGLPPVTEAAFDELVDTNALGDEDELSGSDNDDDDEQEDEGGAAAAGRARIGGRGYVSGRGGVGGLQEREHCRERIHRGVQSRDGRRVAVRRVRLKGPLKGSPQRLGTSPSTKGRGSADKVARARLTAARLGGVP